jgi:hypothetical protein
MRYTLIVISAVLAVVCLWRLIVIIRWRIHRHHERRLLAFTNNAVMTPAVIAVTTTTNNNPNRDAVAVASPTASSSPNPSMTVPIGRRPSIPIGELIRLCIDSQTLLFIFLIVANILTALDSMDPVLSEGIWTLYELSYVIRIFNIPMTLDAVACGIRFYLLIHAKWHTPTRRIIIWFDRYMIGINIASIVGLLLGTIDEFSEIILAFYVILISITIIFLQLGSLLWAQTTLRSLIHRLAASLATSTSAPTIATSSPLIATSTKVVGPPPIVSPSPSPLPSSWRHQNTQSRPLLSAPSSQASPLSPVASMYAQPRLSSSTTTIAPLPSPTLAPSSSTTLHTSSTTSRAGSGATHVTLSQSVATNNQSAYIAAKQMLAVVRWCQFLACVLIILLVWHSIYNLGLE